MHLIIGNANFRICSADHRNLRVRSTTPINIAVFAIHNLRQGTVLQIVDCVVDPVQLDPP